MRKNAFVERLFAAIIDYVFVSIVSFVACALITTTLFAEVFNQQMAPFVLIQLLLNPLSLLLQLVSTPQAFGNAYVVYILFALSFCVEVLYYSIFELLPVKRTPGYILLKIRIYYDNNQLIRTRIVTRNVMKVFSRYAYSLPFIASLLSKNGNTVYDWATKIRIEKTQLRKTDN